MLKTTSIGSRDAGLRSGSGVCRAACCSCWIVGVGRCASARSRSRRSISLHLAGDLPVGRVELAGAAILAQRLLELAARLEHARLVEVLDRRAEHRALERDLIVRAVGIFLQRLAVVLDRGVPVAGARRALAAAERRGRRRSPRRSTTTAATSGHAEHE